MSVVAELAKQNGIALPTTTVTGVASVDGNDPSVKSAAQLAMESRMQKCRDVYDGATTVRAKTTTYLPRLEGESSARYAVRVQLGDLHPGYEQTVNAAKGLILQSEPTFEDDMPSALVDFWEDVDGAHQHGTIFSDALLEAALVDGVAGIFTDFTRPDSPTLDRSKASAAAIPGAPLDAADEAALGLRPYFVLVRADDIIKPLYATIGGLRTLVRFTRREVIEEQVGDFGTRTVTQYRVYRRTAAGITASLYRPNEGETRPVLVSTVTMANATEIPWSPLVASEKKPTLEALADLVLSWWRTANGIESLESLGFVPTPVRIGAPSSYVDANGVTVQGYPPLVLGPGEVIEVPAGIEGGSNTPVYYLQPDPGVLVPAALSLERKEKAMAVINGAFFGLDTNGVESAAAKQQKSRAGNATVGSVARRYKDCLELAYQHLGMFTRLTPGGITVKLTFEDVLMGADVMGAITALVNAGFPVETAVLMLQEGGRLPKHVDVQQVADDWRNGMAAAADLKQLENAAQQQDNTAPPIPGLGTPVPS